VNDRWKDDENETVSDLYEVRNVPHRVFINRQGKSHIKSLNLFLTESELEQYINEIL